ncbi:MAG: CHAT domain-containing protein, partial [Deltaproteobacteria bacterium]
YGYVPNQKILDKEAAALYQLLLRPIEQQLSGKKRLYISPDGNLNLIPFEVLLDEKGAYTIETYQISYIGAGRDIARFEPGERGRKQGLTALILADPDYDFGLSTQEKMAEAGGAAISGEGAASPKTNMMASFARLPDTKKEADTIQGILTSRMSIAVNNYQDKKAVEAVLTTAESPIILHLATHGYFIGKEEIGRNTEGADAGQMLLRDNPMLRSGIALAGINLSLNEGRDEGIITAEKVMGLRLMGTELVVLSACETGLGDVRNGEGVFGLKRAFILSGAKAVVLSLWSVPSEETMGLMTRFYELMADGKTKSDALKQSKLELMKKKPNPFYWGAFILVGNPG